jgi:hypothetical protein
MISLQIAANVRGLPQAGNSKLVSPHDDAHKGTKILFKMKSKL